MGGSDFEVMGAAVHPLGEAADLDGKFEVFTLTLAPGAASPPHSMAQAKLFVVTSGTVSLLLGTETVEAVAGSSYPVPAGTVHRYANTSSATATMFVVVSGAQQLAFLRGMGTLALSGRPDPAAVAEHAQRFDVTLARN